MSGNRWLDDDEVQPTAKGSSRWDDNDFEDFDPNRDYLTQTVERKQDNMYESTMRSLQAIDESERIGVATGEELVRQGEVLNRTEKKLDKMEQDLKESDRHLRSIKSIWGAFVNKFSKEPPPTPAVPDEPTKRSNVQSSLQNAMTESDLSYDQRNAASFHPVLERQEQSRQRFTEPGGSYEQSRPQNDKMQKVEENLDLMSQGLSRLKGLATGMHEEMKAQDPVIDRLHQKTTRVDDKIHATNKQMIKLNHS